VTAGTARPLRTVAFAALDASVWGVAWVAAPEQRSFVALGAGERSGTAAAALHGHGDGDEWRLDGPGVELSASPTGAAVAAAGAGDGSSFDQLCRVRGRVVLDGSERELDCMGRRGAHGHGVKLDRFESVRDVSAWFAPSDGLALVALRPRKSRGQDSDLVEVAVLDPEATAPVTDPRLSTTYTAGGQPLRAGVELWLGDEEEEQHPRRATGEAVGAGAGAKIDGFEVRAQPFRWHSRGRDGAGVYLLARRA
jgi:hypothetical protein